MAKPLVIPILGNTSDLEASLVRSGIVAEDASKKIQGSFRAAGLAAADEAKKIGAGVDEQAAAAGRAAAAFTEMSAKITTAQRNAGKAAATAAGAVGASVDEQRAAYAKAIAVQADYERAVSKAATAAKAAAAEQAAAAEAAAAKVKKAAEMQAAAVESAQKKMSSLGKYALGGGAAIAGFSVKGAMDLQRSMEQIHTQAGASQAEVNKLTKAVMNIAPALGTGPEALAGSLFHVVSGGVPAAHALQVMAAAAKEAKISGADLNDTTTALTATVYSGISGAQNYAKAMGMLNATVGAGDMHFQDLNEALGGPMLATVKGYGLSLHDVSAALATMGDLNIRGADAATQLRMAVQYMAKPAATAGPLLKKLGLNTHSLADAMANGGLMPALQLLHDRFQKIGISGNQMAQVIGDLFTKKGASGIDIMENALGKLGTKYKQTGSTANQQNEAWKATTHTLAFQVDQLKATIGALGDKFGMYLIPKLEAAGNAIKDMIAWMAKHKAAAEVLAGVIAGVLATAITVFAYTKAVAFVKATKDMITGVGKLASGIASIVPTILAKLGLISAGSEATATGVETANGAIETSNAAAGASFSAMATEAGAAEAETLAAMGSLSAGVEASDAAMVTANEAVGASFTALLGPIGLVAAAAGGLAAYGLANGTYGNTSNPNGMGGRGAAVLMDRGANANILGGLPGGYGGNALSGFFGANNPGSHVGTVPGPFGGAQALSGFNNFSGGSVPVPGSGSNAQRIAAALKAQGFSDNAIAGILSNLGAESGGMTLSGISTTAVNPSSGAFGIAQWLGVRKTQEASYAASHGQSPSSLAAQVGFLVQELRTDYHGTFKAIQSASSPQQAAALFETMFEKAGAGAVPSHQALAAQALAMVGGSKGLSTAQLDALLNSAGQGTKTTAAKTIRTLLYANPFGGPVTNERVDEGQDFAAPNGTAIRAIGSGTVVVGAGQDPNGFDHQPYIAYRLTQGPNAGKVIYVAEGIAPTVRAGQQVRAGQTIALSQNHGTGIEMGFANPNNALQTLAKATTGYVEGQVTPAGKAFASFLREIGTNGVYQTSKGGVISGGGQNFGITVAQAIQNFIQSLQKATNSLIQSYQTLEQSGTVRTLTKALGVNTSGTVTTANPPVTGPGSALLNWANPTTTASVATVIRNAVESADTGGIMAALNAGKNPTQLDKTLVPILEKASANSQATKNFDTLVAELRGAGKTGQANALISARGGVFATLAQEMYAEQVTKDGESLALQATQLKDQTTLQANTDAQMLAIQKAVQQKQSDALAAQTTYIKDMSTTVQDRFAGIVQAIEDATQRMADSSDALVQGIDDQTQIKVDLLGERGLFGLNLIAQREQVQLDLMKASYDQQIANAQINVDQVTATAHTNENLAQIHLDQVTTQQDQLVARAQAMADTVTIAQNIKILAAQQAMDTTTLHEDMSVVGPAQMAVDMGATLPKAQQDVLNGILKRAQGQAGVAEGQAGATYQGVYGAAQSAIGSAAGFLSETQGKADKIIATANATLVTVTGQGNQAIADANQALQGIKDTAAQAEGTLQGVIDVTKATASTQFAGSGLVVNMYGIPMDNGAAIGSAMDWFARTQLGALS